MIKYRITGFDKFWLHGLLVQGDWYEVLPHQETLRTHHSKVY